MDKASKKAAMIYRVSAWAQHNSLVLGQVKVDDKSNTLWGTSEITAIPKLLSRLDIAGAVVTIDAMGCHLCPVGKRKLPNRLSSKAATLC